ncbi:MAG: XRE family transcriptional regulator [Paraburkholderia sp.]|uniref:Helix-turn-helix domain-containing protein n=1 Tax=Paraburkholderia sartisoli TaxID=83784 RepID=A0A1H4CXZ9_9BURK|nr:MULTISPECIES: helix-turn-helix transcriptional regulator [Paraburkholderia]TAL92681.1 MAG: XRE family transcriptional regulator [Paraburkholderia sp.]SEA65363.1 Helix-turn-helix domain-containing protein [Paraburkholderia sartisoli]
MKHIQFIEQNGHAAFAVVPIDIWNRVSKLVEDAEDIAAFDEAVQDADDFRIPAAVLDAELAGDHPVKAWRMYRRLTIDALAEAAGVSKPYVSQIENGKRKGGSDVFERLATALDVPVDALIDGDEAKS